MLKSGPSLKELQRKRARDILKIEAESRNDKLVLVERNLHYKLEEMQEHLKSGETSHQLDNLYCRYLGIMQDLDFVPRLWKSSGFPFLMF